MYEQHASLGNQRAAVYATKSMCLCVCMYIRAYMHVYVCACVCLRSKKKTRKILLLSALRFCQRAKQQKQVVASKTGECKVIEWKILYSYIFRLSLRRAIR